MNVFLRKGFKMKNDALLSRILQGVEFTIDVSGLPVPALATRSYLERRCGAGTDPETWLLAFARCRVEICEAAQERYRIAPDVKIVILDGDRSFPGGRV